MGERKYQRDLLPCTCGHGYLEVEVTTFGVWRVEGLMERCPFCGSANFTAARERLIASTAQPGTVSRTDGRN